MAKIVILGGSFGGLTSAFELERLLGKRAEITVLSDEDKFTLQTASLHCHTQKEPIYHGRDSLKSQVLLLLEQFRALAVLGLPMSMSLSLTQN